MALPYLGLHKQMPFNLQQSLNPVDKQRFQTTTMGFNYLIDTKLLTFFQLVWQCQDLMDLWMLESSGSLRDSDVSDLEQQYLAVYMGLTHCLEAVTAEMEDELDPCK